MYHLDHTQCISNIWHNDYSLKPNIIHFQTLQRYHQDKHYDQLLQVLTLSQTSPGFQVSAIRVF